ncbi:MAG: prepilin-type N-terminal cleavage/methylation domain-containing protein [Sedimentisphaerales bacterium]|nr:prepilin-type N-terminal cleavage/methylation domain-containing protein [Sedimentisphaerales bacterium]
MQSYPTSRKGFSLVELVIVIVILGVIAAIAIPRISSGSKNAGEAALRANLQSLRNAIDWYYGEHNNVFPGHNDDGGSGPDSEGSFKNQLLQYSDSAGAASTTKDAAHPFGPYLRASFPKQTVGAKAGNDGVHVVTDATALVPELAQNAGWIYSTATGQIIPNVDANATGADGVKFVNY